MSRYRMTSARPARKVNAAGAGGGVGVAIAIIFLRILEGHGLTIDPELEWATLVLVSIVVAWFAGYVVPPAAGDRIQTTRRAKL